MRTSENVKLVQNPRFHTVDDYSSRLLTIPFKSIGTTNTYTSRYSAGSVIMASIYRRWL